MCVHEYVCVFFSPILSHKVVNLAKKKKITELYASPSWYLEGTYSISTSIQSHGNPVLKPSGLLYLSRSKSGLLQGPWAPGRCLNPQHHPRSLSSGPLGPNNSISRGEAGCLLHPHAFHARSLCQNTFPAHSVPSRNSYLSFSSGRHLPLLPPCPTGDKVSRAPSWVPCISTYFSIQISFEFLSKSVFHERLELPESKERVLTIPVSPDLSTGADWPWVKAGPGAQKYPSW